MVRIKELTQERILDLTTLKTRIIEAGEGYPTFCVHGVGFTNGANSWLSCIQSGLAENLHIIAIDQLGWGPADRPVMNYQFGALVDHIREIQDKLGYEKINLVGHSLGGWVGATLAYESPERLNKLVIVANAGLNPEPPAGLLNFQPPTREAVADTFKDVPDQELRETLITEAWRNVATPNSVESFRKLVELFNDMEMRARYFLRRRLSHIYNPTLIVYGSRDRGYPPETFGREMHEGIVGSRFEVLDSGHAIPTERPDELTGLIKEFLS